MALIVNYDENNNPVVIDDATGQIVDRVGNWQNSVDSIAPNLSTVIEQNKSGDEPWYVSAQKIMTGLLMTDQQRKLLNVQIDRAQKGLPPLDLTNYTGVGVRVGIAPQTQQLLIYGGLAFLAVMLLRRR